MFRTSLCNPSVLVLESDLDVALPEKMLLILTPFLILVRLKCALWAAI